NPSNDPEQHWFDWVIARILLRECEEQVLQTDRSMAPTGASAADYRALGEWHAWRQEWPEAAEWFGALLKVNQLDDWDIATLDYLACGAALAERGDRGRFEDFREEAIGRFKGTDVQAAAERIIKISLLQSADGKALTALGPLAEAAAPPLSQSDENTAII